MNNYIIEIQCISVIKDLKGTNVIKLRFVSFYLRVVLVVEKFERRGANNEK